MAAKDYRTPQEMEEIVKVAPSPLLPEAMGLVGRKTQLALQMDMAKEIANKIAWVLGSVYQVPYSNRRTVPRTYAWLITKAIIRDHGYPCKIRK